MQDGSYAVTGRALLGEDLREEHVTIVVSGGVITSIEPCSGSSDRWIVPAFFNAHTHLGDTVAMDLPVRGSLAELVKPPNGLKHRILAATPRTELVRGMRASIAAMVATGTAGFADFREGGPDGVAALREAAAGLDCRPVILGRQGGERVSDGAGISSVHDVAGAEETVREARGAGKLVAFHAGEKNPDDIDEALEFEPDLLVHCTHATETQLCRIVDMEIPIVVCPRSNWLLGVAASPAHPPITRILELGGRFFLGTDNAMFVQPDLLQEMAFTAAVYRAPPVEILRAAISGAALAGRSGFIEEGQEAHLLAIDPRKSNLSFSNDIRATIVKRLDSSGVSRNILTLQ
ncbi:amidohydrolase family protein [Methanoculleus sp. Wushi-C6]|uniref:Amidohydrolase family protein n=1 Tax=Methanoculleus caldifontis TaxID=2651577 RepID=A0ABU3X350_9EURY|nr:amidohydrolase family protein [Methanoculleus sp. Wushi-C6]MDV2482489.1 amidohydrolase family protein [Methanoculleus sp. Wushi-C6]